MATLTRKRLDPAIFDLPVNKMRAGYYTDAYFNHTRSALLVTTAAGNALARRAPAHLRTTARATTTLGAVVASAEIFGWMVRNPEKRLARALARPGHQLQHSLATAEPTPEQIEVAEAALQACLQLESDGAQHQNRG